MTTNEELKNITTISDEECISYPQEYLDSFQCAQDPLEGFTQEFLNMQNQSKPLHTGQRRRKTSCKRRSITPGTLNKHHGATHSFVINSAPKKGLRLIKIKVLELNGSQRAKDYVEDDYVVLSSQYVVKDIGDEIMDQTEKIISNISKKICGYSYTSCF